MSINASDFNDKFALLMSAAKSAEPLETAFKALQKDPNAAQTEDQIAETAYKAFCECQDYIQKEEEACLTAMKSGIPKDVKGMPALEAQVKKVTDLADSIKKLFESRVGPFIGKTGHYISLFSVNLEQEKIQKLLKDTHLALTIIDKDSELKKSWDALTPEKQKTAMERFMSYNSVHEYGIDDAARTNALKILIHFQGPLDELKVDPAHTTTLSAFYARHGYFDHGKAVESIEKILNSLKNVKGNDKNPPFQAGMVILEQHIISIKGIDQYFGYFDTLCRSDHFDPKLLDGTALPMISIYVRDPVFFKELRAKLKEELYKFGPKFAIFNAIIQHYKTFDKYASPSESAAILELLNNLPGEAEFTIRALFKNAIDSPLPEHPGGLSPARIKKIGSFFIWINEQIKADPSPKNKARLSGILERMVVVMLKKPQLADCILKLPLPKYTLIEKIFKNRNDIHTLEENEIKDALKEAGEEGLIPALFDATDSIILLFQKIAVQSPTIEQGMHAFLDNVLRMHAPALVTANLTVADKLKKLPVHYAQNLERMLELAYNDGKAFVEMLRFAAKHPYSKTIALYLDNIATRLPKLSEADKKAGIAETLQSVNILAEDFPNATAQLLATKLEDIPALMTLHKINKPITGLLLERHPGWLDDSRATRISSNPDLQKGLREVLDIEVRDDVSLLEMFNWAVTLLGSPSIVGALKKDSEFGIRLKSMMSIFRSSQIEDLIKDLPDLLDKDPVNTIHFVKSFAQFPKTTKKLLLRSAPDVRTRFFALTKSKDPVDAVRLSHLVEWEEEDLADQLLTLYKTEPDLTHRLLDMAAANYIPDVKEILKLKTFKSAEALTNKLLAIAGSAQAPLINKILLLDPQKDAVLLKILLDSPGKDVPPLFAQMMVLRARGEEGLIKHMIEILTAGGGRKTHAQAAVKAVEEGRFEFAKLLLRDEGRPFIASGAPIASIASLQKWNELLNDWKAFDKTGLQPIEIRLIEQFLLPFAAKFAQGDDARSFVAWAGKVQFLLQHNPQRLLQVISQPDWKKVDLWDISKEFSQAMEAQLKHAALDTEAGNSAVTQLTLAFAHCLLTPSGALNEPIADMLQNVSAFQKIAQIPYTGAYILSVLNTFRDNPEFGERLAALQNVPHPSRQQRILATTLGLPANTPVALRQAKQCILGALLWPLRQGPTGSCFGTSTVIQLSSSPHGLMQSLEDYLSMLGNGCLKRRSEEPNQGTVEYPLVMGDEAAFKLFNGDNILSRTYEYSLSSMAATPTQNMKLALEKKWSEGFIKTISYECNLHTGKKEYDAAIASIYMVPLTLDTEPLTKLVYNTLMKEIQNSCGMVFNGYAKHPIEDKVGAWVVYDTETGEPLSNEGALPKFYDKAFARAKQELVKADPKNAKFFEELFDKKLVELVKSTEFNEKVGASEYYQSDKFAGLPTINPYKYAHLGVSTPFIDYRGGDPKQLMSILHGSQVRYASIAHSQNPYEIFFSKAQLLTDAEFAQAQSKEWIYKTVSSPDHAFNFKAGEAVRLFQNKSPAAVWAAEQKQLAEVENTPLTPAMSKAIVDAFMESNIPEVRPQLQFVLEPKLKTSATIRALCDALNAVFSEVRGKTDEKGFFADTVEVAIRKLPEVKGKFPKDPALYDSNWKRAVSYGFGKKIYDRSMKRSMPIADEQIYRENWTPGDFDKFTAYQYRDSTNPYFRTYFHQQ